MIDEMILANEIDVAVLKVAAKIFHSQMREVVSVEFARGGEELLAALECALEKLGRLGFFQMLGFVMLPLLEHVWELEVAFGAHLVQLVQMTLGYMTAQVHFAQVGLVAVLVVTSLKKKFKVYYIILVQGKYYLMNQ